MEMSESLREWLTQNELESPTHLDDVIKILEVLAQHLDDLKGGD